MPPSHKNSRVDGGGSDVRVIDLDDGRTLTKEDIATLRELAVRYRALKWLMVCGMTLVGTLALDKLVGFIEAHWK